jgi:heme-degrading monooxygenase HmoA
MFIAMNHFTVTSGREEDFEQQWRTRERYLAGVPGFVQFMLLKGDTPGEYISHSHWQDRQSFQNWTQSEAFSRAHRQGSVAGILTGPPVVRLYEAILHEVPDTVPAGD